MTGTIHPLIDPATWWQAWSDAGGKYRRLPGPDGDTLVQVIEPPAANEEAIARLQWQRDTAFNRAAIIAHKRDADVEF